MSFKEYMSWKGFWQRGCLNNNSWVFILIRDRMNRCITSSGWETYEWKLILFNEYFTSDVIDKIFTDIASNSKVNRKSYERVNMFLYYTSLST